MRLTPMEIALLEAQSAKKQDEVPVGAVITHGQTIIARAGNYTKKSHDPTGHAEMRVIRIACQIFKSERIPECDLYVTLEPCTMCAAAISFARIRNLYYATKDSKGGAIEHGSRFYQQSTCHHKPNVYSGFKEKEASQLLKDFFIQKRHQK
ncbi:nucleoside deaminase [Bartonella sp. AR 15-3]|uniref:nucleoside deaminase n=1 Tax=Bartonella sp. AR 15-3 TaxID=545617 RepID=UPI0001F4BF7B|nr:nucleoside deaminase [Bartonella sp. AR 15-3]OPB31138.1 tRNA(Arg) A34 adenosine deaminase TadA [Bartonella sp. AR 15-3]CBI78749.1 Cytosine/adenosine deaminase [Bartonella sp. AR 15-3]